MSKLGGQKWERVIINFISETLETRGRIHIGTLCGSMSQLVSRYGQVIKPHIKLNKIRDILHENDAIFDLDNYDRVTIRRPMAFIKFKESAPKKFPNFADAVSIEPPAISCEPLGLPHEEITGIGKITSLFPGIGFIENANSREQTDSIYFTPATVFLPKGKKVDKLTNALNVGNYVWYKATANIAQVPSKWKAVRVEQTKLTKSVTSAPVPQNDNPVVLPKGVKIDIKIPMPQSQIIQDYQNKSENHLKNLIGKIELVYEDYGVIASPTKNSTVRDQGIMVCFCSGVCFVNGKRLETLNSGLKSGTLVHFDASFWKANIMVATCVWLNDEPKMKIKENCMENMNVILSQISSENSTKNPVLNTMYDALDFAQTLAAYDMDHKRSRSKNCEMSLVPVSAAEDARQLHINLILSLCFMYPSVAEIAIPYLCQNNNKN